MTPTQQFVIELVKEVGNMLSKNTTFFLALLSAFGAGLHMKQPKYMRKNVKPE